MPFHIYIISIRTGKYISPLERIKIRNSFRLLNKAKRLSSKYALIYIYICTYTKFENNFEKIIQIFEKRNNEIFIY